MKEMHDRRVVILRIPVSVLKYSHDFKVAVPVSQFRGMNFFSGCPINGRYVEGAFLPGQSKNSKIKWAQFKLLTVHCNSGFKNSLGVLSGRFQSQSLARISKELN